MSEEIPSGAPAPTPEAAPTPSPSEAVANLQADKDWSADFSGANGRQAQKVAMDRKTSLLKPAEDDAPVPEHLREALEDSSTKPFAEGRIPASDPSEYKFTFNDAESFEHSQELTSIAQETAYAVGANPQFAQATVSHIQERLGRVPEGASVDANPGAFDSAIADRYGDKATDTINNAEAALNAMPPEGKAWVQNTLRALDPETATWFTGCLASTQRAKK
ncbi:hypothetical protein OAI11_00825 [Rhodospirillales bacterium]|nr:hypothetical protein [Rhodospirillales bacterium]